MFSKTVVTRELFHSALLDELNFLGLDFSEVYKITRCDKTVDPDFKPTYYIYPNAKETIIKCWADTFPKIKDILSQQGNSKKIPNFDLDVSTLLFDSSDKIVICEEYLCSLVFQKNTPTGKPPLYPVAFRLYGYSKNGSLIIAFLYFKRDGIVGRVEISSSNHSTCDRFDKSI